MSEHHHNGINFNHDDFHHHHGDNNSTLIHQHRYTDPLHRHYLDALDSNFGPDDCYDGIGPADHFHHPSAKHTRRDPHPIATVLVSVPNINRGDLTSRVTSINPPSQLTFFIEP